jgi:hypothetical protein
MLACAFTAEFPKVFETLNSQDVSGELVQSMRAKKAIAINCRMAVNRERKQAGKFRDRRSGDVKAAIAAFIKSLFQIVLIDPWVSEMVMVVAMLADDFIEIKQVLSDLAIICTLQEISFEDRIVASSDKVFFIVNFCVSVTL